LHRSGKKFGMIAGPIGFSIRCIAIPQGSDHDARK
jgi:hypothetical protein